MEHNPLDSFYLINQDKRFEIINAVIKCEMTFEPIAEYYPFNLILGCKMFLNLNPEYHTKLRKEWLELNGNGKTLEDYENLPWELKLKQTLPFIKVSSNEFPNYASQTS